MIAHLILVFCWGFYFFIHSWMASDKVKIWVRRHMSFLNSTYRIFYNLISIVGFLGIMIFSGIIGTPTIYSNTNVSMVISLILTTWGVIYIKRSFRLYNLKAFIGFSPDPLLKPKQVSEKLQVDGILAKVRHPIYTGSILIVLGFLVFRFSITNLINTGCILIYLMIGIQLEEKKLINKFGQAYLEYKKKVPMIIPKFK